MWCGVHWNISPGIAVHKPVGRERIQRGWGRDQGPPVLCGAALPAAVAGEDSSRQQATRLPDVVAVLALMPRGESWQLASALRYGRQGAYGPYGFGSRDPP